MSKMDLTLCILGFGYTASFVAAQCKLSGFRIIGTSRDPKTRAQGEKKGYQLIDFSAEVLQKVLPEVTHLLITIAPSATEGEPSLNRLQETQLKQFPSLKCIIYLSSTSVYGDHQGAWVDENSPSLKLDAIATKRLAAEAAWSQFAERHKLPLFILRVAGIYGPGRNVLCQLQNDKKYSLYKEGQVFSRIHVEDLAATIMAALQKKAAAGIYNVCDDEPAASQVVDLYATQLLKKEPLPLVPIEEAGLSLMAQHFYNNNRRVSNKKLKERLGVKLLYPSYREGLINLLAGK